MSTTAPTVNDTLLPPPAFLVGITRQGVAIPVGDAFTDLLGVPELTLLAALSAGGGALSDVVAEVADRTGTRADGLRVFAEGLAGRGLLRPPTGAERPVASHGPASTPPEVVGAFAPDDLLVVAAPQLFHLRAGGFDQLDHGGYVRITLSAVELLATSEFRQPMTRSAAFEAHTAAAGAAALDGASFDVLIGQLARAGVLHRFDPTDAGLQRAFAPQLAEIRREMQGRHMMNLVNARRVAEHDAAEREREERTGVSRIKVVPVNFSWRNPPIALGMVVAYARMFEGGRLEELYDFRPDWHTDPEAFEWCRDEPAIFIFSNYVWTAGQNLEFSARVKAMNPNNVTVHGGADVPKFEVDLREYFRKNPQVDVAVGGEGEATFAELLAALAPSMATGSPDLTVLDAVPGLAYRHGDEIRRTGDRDRITDLDTLPSPYLMGLFDGFTEAWRAVVRQSEDQRMDAFGYRVPVVVLETNRGCPYGCTFCDWGSNTQSRIRKFSLDRVFAELEWCAHNEVQAVGLADANFGIFERDVSIAEKVVELKAAFGFPRDFGNNYAKNTVKHLKRIVDVLVDGGILALGQLSLQSMDEETLNTIDRSNIKLEKYEDLAREFRRAGLPLYVDLMVGLPGQTMGSFQNDLQECIDREVHAKIFPTQLLVNSPMNEPSYKQRLGIQAGPGSMVVSSASFTRQDYEEMLLLRGVFLLTEKFGVLRHVARHVRYETGRREIDFIEQLRLDARADRDRWPLLSVALEVVPELLVPPASWQLFFDELRDYLVTVVGVVEEPALDTVLAVQHALVPARERTFPITLELAHDYPAWHAAMIEAKEEGHLRDWPTVIPPLRSFGPATFGVDDTRRVSLFDTGPSGRINPFSLWELDSVVSRHAVTQSEAVA